ncbi:MAG TPA: hydrolase, partial [Propionibacteriaceae bacterium]|nr:hydrolase [Propionibacteriaceae bacterium]
MGANAVGMDSLFVFTGAHGKADLLEVDESGRPTHLGFDLRALLDEPRELELAGDDTARCRDQVAVLSGDTITLEVVPTTRDAQLDALWAVLALLWSRPGVDGSVAGRLDLIP